jgi:hypothetical protein
MYALTTNATRSKKLPPFVIGKAKKPCVFGNQLGAQLGFHYQNSAKAWMTSILYQEWLQNWDRELHTQGQKILLLQDNFSGHIAPSGLENIWIKSF